MFEASRLGGGLRDHDSRRWADWARIGGVHDPCACRIHAHPLTGPAPPPNGPPPSVANPDRGIVRGCLTSPTLTCLWTNGRTVVRSGGCGNTRCTTVIGKTPRLPRVPVPTTLRPWSG